MSRTPHTNRTPNKSKPEKRKDAGHNYGGARRAAADQEAHSVDDEGNALERPSLGPWSGNFGARTRASNIRAEEEPAKDGYGR